MVEILATLLQIQGTLFWTIAQTVRLVFCRLRPLFLLPQATCGSYHTAAVTDLGELYTWGGGMYGKVSCRGAKAAKQTKKHQTNKGEENQPHVSSFFGLPPLLLLRSARRRACNMEKRFHTVWYCKPYFVLPGCIAFCSFVGLFDRFVVL